MMFSSIFLIIPCFSSSVQRRKRKDIGLQHIPPAIPWAADILSDRNARSKAKNGVRERGVGYNH
jgi:hypothetical protein